jgi:hypothetical protein
MDSSLMNLEFKDNNGSDVLKEFQSQKTEYIYKVQGNQQTVTILSCAPSYKSAKVFVTIGSADPFEYGNNTLSKQTITLPAPGADDLVVRFKVQAQDAMYTREYKVSFTNPKSTSKWIGTITLNNNSSPAYKVSGLTVVSAAGASYPVSSVSGDGNNWSIDIDQTAASAQNPPASFIVLLEKPESASDNAKIIPYRFTIAANSGIAPGNSIALAVDVGGSGANAPFRTVYTAADLKSLDEDANQSVNYILANDIDLSDIEWEGPSKYAGTFNGNGYKVTLKLKNGGKDTGMFNNLGNGAVIENLKVNVSTPNTIAITNSIFFGGLVGGIRQSGTYIIRNISVSGEIKYSSIASGQYLLAGGIIGQAFDSNTNNIDLLIENCEVDLTIDASFTNNNGNINIISIGGIIGKFADKAGKVEIKNCASGGSIIASSLNGPIRAGGIVGSSSDDGEGSHTHSESAGTLSIENCYSTTEIELNYLNTSNTYLSAAGGIAGFLSNKNAEVKNSIVFNPSILATHANSSANTSRFAARVIGTASVNVKHTGNYALDSMLVGTAADNKTMVNSNDAGSINGESKTAQELSSAQFWKGLGFGETAWYFTGLNITNKVYPKLK